MIPQLRLYWLICHTGCLQYHLHNHFVSFLRVKICCLVHTLTSGGPYTPKVRTRWYMSVRDGQRFVQWTLISDLLRYGSSFKIILMIRRSYCVVFPCELIKKRWVVVNGDINANTCRETASSGSNWNQEHAALGDVSESHLFMHYHRQNRRRLRCMWCCCFCHLSCELDNDRIKLDNILISSNQTIH